MKSTRQPIVTLTLFKFDTIGTKFWALKGMSESHAGIRDTDGLTFYKLMGSGGNGGFSWYPNFSVYAFLGVWHTMDKAVEFFSDNSKLSEYQSKAYQSITFYMSPVSAKGAWSGTVPFEGHGEPHDGPLAILTRARIRTGKLPEFWSNVGKTARAVLAAPGCLISLGVGEWPIFEQATFSIWTSGDDVQAFAYKQQAHAGVVRKTRTRNWYSEEFFARLALIRAEGHWFGLESSLAMVKSEAHDLE